MKGGEKMEVKKGRRMGLTVVALALFFCMVSGTITLAGAAVVKVAPADQVVTAGGSFSVDVRVEDVMYMGADMARLNFDPGAMQATGIVEGDWLKNWPGGGGTIKVEDINNTIGKVTFSYALKNPGVGATGSDVLATINFNMDPAAAPGTYNLDLVNACVKLKDGDGNTIPSVSVSDGTVTIKPVPVPGLSGTGMVAAIGVLAIVLAMSAMRKRRK